MSPFAVIDLGSNSIRLVVYEQLSRSMLTHYNERRFCGLGTAVAETGRLGFDERTCAAATVRRYVLLARAMGAGEIVIAATAAVRDAADGAIFVAELEQSTGEQVTVLDGSAEAELGARGILAGFDDPRGIVGDLGGGSVELASLAIDDKTQLRRSFPLGGLVLLRALQQGRRQLDALIERHLSTATDLAGVAENRNLYVIGGSWRALARMRMAMTGAPLRIVHGYRLSAAEAQKLTKQLASVDPKDLQKLQGVSRRRAELAPVAAILLGRMIELLRPDAVVFSATGLREGIVHARLEPTTELADPLMVGAAEVAHAGERVRGIGDALATWTDALFSEEQPAQSRLRRAACLVSDIGWRDHPESRAREAFFRLVQYPFLAIDHQERVFLALVILGRYEGRPEDRALARLLSLLPPTEQRRALAVGAALDLGFRLSGGVPDILAHCRLMRRAGVLVLAADHPAIDLEDEAITGRLRTLASALGMEHAAIRARAV